MPTSAQSALSASARLSVDGSDCDREPARDNVYPWNVDDHRRAPTCAGCLHCDARCVHRDQLTFDHRLCLAAPIVDVDALTVETLVLLMGAQRTLGASR